MADTLLELTNVETAYGRSQVLFGVSFAIAAGQMVTLMGRNGMGKTTTVRSIMGLTPARSGSIRFRGEEIAALAPYRIAQRGLGLVPEGRRIFPNLTVRENLLATAAPKPDGWTLDKVHALFPRLAERRHHGGNNLSGGEQQMLAIARALVANPTLLVMDEPTEGLAPAVVAEVGRLIRQLREDGISVLLVEQNAAFAVDVADVTHVMHQGTIVHSSAPEALWKNEEIKTQYLGVPGGIA